MLQMCSLSLTCIASLGTLEPWSLEPEAWGLGLGAWGLGSLGRGTLLCPSPPALPAAVERRGIGTSLLADSDTPLPPSDGVFGGYLGIIYID